MWLLLPLILSSALAFTIVELPVSTSVFRTEPVERWVDVRLNHFKANNNETFPMRYYYEQLNDTDVNIVIVVGADWEISHSIAESGLAYDIAKILNASLFYTEHRYYGKSRPTEGISTSELRYLTVDQSLADLAQFIQYIRSEDFEHGQYKSASVVLVGCSLAGSLATWLRLGYPHLVDVVISDSGPLQALENFSEYLDVVFRELQNQGGEPCIASINLALTEFNTTLSTPAGLVQISNMFNTCSTVSASSAIDISTLAWFGIITPLANLVQHADPDDIPEACSMLTNPFISSPLQRLARWVGLGRPDACLETRYTEVVAALRNTSYEAPHSDLRLWTYQSCVEFGWYRTTDNSLLPAFNATVPPEFFQQMCKDFFSAEFTQDFTRAGISRTNLFFGGLSHMPDYVISVQGTGDPWSLLGPKQGHSTAKSPVFVINGASQCNAMGSIDDSPTQEIKDVKTAVLDYVNYFVNGVQLSSASRAVSSLVLTVAVIAALIGSM